MSKQKEIKFEKVVEWKDREEDLLIPGVMFGLCFIIIIIALAFSANEVIYLVSIAALIICVIAVVQGIGKRKVYWRRIK